MGAIMSGAYANKAVAGNQALSCTSPAGAWHIWRYPFREPRVMCPPWRPQTPKDRWIDPRP